MTKQMIEWRFVAGIASTTLGLVTAGCGSAAPGDDSQSSSGAQTDATSNETSSSGSPATTGSSTSGTGDDSATTGYCDPIGSTPFTVLARYDDGRQSWLVAIEGEEPYAVGSDVSGGVILSVDDSMGSAKLVQHGGAGERTHEVELAGVAWDLSIDGMGRIFYAGKVGVNGFGGYGAYEESWTPYWSPVSAFSPREIAAVGDGTAVLARSVTQRPGYLKKLGPDGTPAWTVDLRESTALLDVVVTGTGRIALSDHRDGVDTFSSMGEPQWSVSTTTASALAAFGNALVIADSGWLRGYDDAGVVAWEVQAERPLDGGSVHPCVADQLVVQAAGRVSLVSTENVLQAFDLDPALGFEPAPSDRVDATIIDTVCTSEGAIVVVASARVTHYSECGTASGGTT